MFKRIFKNWIEREDQGRTAAQRIQEIANGEKTEEAPPGVLESVFYGIRHFLKNFFPLLGLSGILVFFPISIAQIILFEFEGAVGKLGSLIAFFASFVVMYIGMINISLRICRGKEFHLRSIAERINMFWRMLISVLVRILVIASPILVSTVFFIEEPYERLYGLVGEAAPSVAVFILFLGLAVSLHLFLRFFLADVFIVDAGFGPFSAMKMSYDLSGDLSIFLLLLLLFVITVAAGVFGSPFYFLFSALRISRYNFLLKLVAPLVAAPTVILSIVYFYEGRTGGVLNRKKLKKKFTFFFCLGIITVLSIIFLAHIQDLFLIIEVYGLEVSEFDILGLDLHIEDLLFSL